MRMTFSIKEGEIFPQRHMRVLARVQMLDALIVHVFDKNGTHVSTSTLRRVGVPFQKQKILINGTFLQEDRLCCLFEITTQNHVLGNRIIQTRMWMNIEK